MRTAPLRPARPPATHPRVTICGRWSQTAMDAAPLSSPLASVHGRRGPTHPPSTALPCVHGSVLDLPPLRSRPTLLQFRLPSLGPARTTAGRRAPPSPPVPGTPQSQPPATALPRQNQGRHQKRGPSRFHSSRQLGHHAAMGLAAGRSAAPALLHRLRHPRRLHRSVSLHSHCWMVTLDRS